ncbi:MAG: hypothetical protein KBT04_03010 [Bacteroidales bacterium]|nr:hypothetical protein [Candidatus Colimorpha onthohippi]
MNHHKDSAMTTYNHDITKAFFARWWKLLTIVFVIAAVVSVVVSLLITPRYKSSAVIFPTNSNRISKAIMDYHYSLDFMDYGIERDCEYAIQILSSQSMREAVCERFNLMEHYGIKPDDPHKKFKLADMYNGYITVKRTEFLGVEIGVLDTDPIWAADIANYIAEYYDTLCHNIHHARAVDAANVMQGVCKEMESDFFATENQLSEHPKAAAQLIADKSKKLADLQTRASQTQVDANSSVSYKFWLDHATPADKKAWPKRILVVLLGSIGALVLTILLLLIFCKIGNNEE